jgi:hypothetical protein
MVPQPAPGFRFETWDPSEFRVDFESGKRASIWALAPEERSFQRGDIPCRSPSQLNVEQSPAEHSAAAVVAH